MNQDSVSFLHTLADSAYASIGEGYYEVDALPEAQHQDLEQSIRVCSKNPVIAEVKFASPSQGVIRTDLNAVSAAEAMVQGGAVGLSVLTEPKHFGGSLESFALVRRAVGLPLLMKDVVVSRVQLDAAWRLGADAVLLIYRLFERGMCESDLEGMIGYAHSKGLQVLLEVHDRDEFDKAVETDADLVGVNNRDLETLSVDLSTTLKILESAPRRGKMVVSESGIKTAEDVRLLRKAGADAFLVGTSIMKSPDIASKVRELVEA
ncbi:MAG: indole-3-glycerol-phosphate synthase [Nitrososphaerales archaeon]